MSTKILLYILFIHVQTCDLHCYSWFRKTYVNFITHFVSSFPPKSTCQVHLMLYHTLFCIIISNNEEQTQIRCMVVGMICDSYMQQLKLTHVRDQRHLHEPLFKSLVHMIIERYSKKKYLIIVIDGRCTFYKIVPRWKLDRTTLICLMALSQCWPSSMSPHRVIMSTGSTVNIQTKTLLCQAPAVFANKPTSGMTNLANRNAKLDHTLGKKTTP